MSNQIELLCHLEYMMDETAIFIYLQTYVLYTNTTVLGLYSCMEITVLGNPPLENSPPDKSPLGNNTPIIIHT